MIERKAGTADFSNLSGDATATAGGLLTLADIFKKFRNTSVITENDHVLTAANVLTGNVILAPTADSFNQLPSVASLIAAIPNCVVGSNFHFSIQNLSVNKYTYIGDAGTEYTFIPPTQFSDTILVGQSAIYKIFITSITPGSETASIMHVAHSPVGAAHDASNIRLADGLIPIGNGGGWAEERSMTGEVSITNLGATTVGVLPGTRIELSEVGTATYDDVQDFFNLQSAGRISGGVLSTVDATHISVTAGKGIIRDNTTSTATMKFVDFSANTNLLITANLTNYIYVDYNGGTPIIAATTTHTNINKNSHFVLGAAFGNGVETPYIVTTGMNAINWAVEDHNRLVECRRVERASGGVIAETGTRNISTTDGVFYIAGTRQTITAKDTSGTDKFTYVYRASPSGWTEVANQTQIDNVYYDDGTGTLNDLTANRYGVHWVYILYDGSIYVLYGQGDYTLAQSQEAQLPSTVPIELHDFGILAAKIIIKKSASAFTEIASAYITPFATSNPVDHNDLGGLQGGTTGEYYHTTSAQNSALHGAVTLDTNADTILSLSTQALGLDTQTANTSLMGPVSGAAAVPTFRSTVDADVPATLNPTIAGLAVSANSATPGDVRVSITNTNAAGDSRFSVVNSTGGTFAAQVTGSTYPSVPNVAALASDSSISALVFSTDGDIATGGDGYISFKTGGYNAAQERMRILADGNVKVNNLTASRMVVTDGSTYFTSGTNTDADVADAVTKKHVAVTVSAPIVISTQALSLNTPQLIGNLKPVVNAAANKLDIFTKSGGAVPDATNIITVAIPDGNGATFRSREATYLSGTSQFILADGVNYWNKGSLDGEIKTAYIYAIWDGTGIIWALGGYSGFTRCPASTTETDDDFFLLEASSTYTKAVTEYCVCVGKIRYQYDTGDTPDHTIQATVLDAPQVMWNPRSDYGYQKNLAVTNTQGGDIGDDSANGIVLVVKQSGKYKISFSLTAGCNSYFRAILKTGSATYASATGRNWAQVYLAGGAAHASNSSETYLNVGDYIHMGAAVVGSSGNRIVYGDDSGAPYVGGTNINFHRID
jgi:hypothetical protein